MIARRHRFCIVAVGMASTCLASGRVVYSEFDVALDVVGVEEFVVRFEYGDDLDSQ